MRLFLVLLVAFSPLPLPKVIFCICLYMCILYFPLTISSLMEGSMLFLSLYVLYWAWNMKPNGKVRSWTCNFISTKGTPNEEKASTSASHWEVRWFYSGSFHQLNQIFLASRPALYQPCPATSPTHGDADWLIDHNCPITKCCPFPKFSVSDESSLSLSLHFL